MKIATCAQPQRAFAFALLMMILGTDDAAAQKPVIAPNGIVNAASYGEAVVPGSLASIFGTNLARVEQSATRIPLPEELGGVTVTIDGSPAPLLFVSPDQINIQVPNRRLNPSAQVIVIADGVASEPAKLPVTLTVDYRPGVFTLDASGCGPAPIVQTSAGRPASRNSTENAASPGDYLSIWVTGLGTNFDLPTGLPAPPTPLLPIRNEGRVSIGGRVAGLSFAGKAPGLVGVDQVNVQIPAHVPEGCAVPFQLFSDVDFIASQTVPVSIRAGGGRCVDPPPDSFGLLTLQRTEISDPGQFPTTRDELKAEFLAAIGKTVPTRNPFPPPGRCACSIPRTIRPVRDCGGFEAYSDRPLNAGDLEVRLPDGTRQTVSPIIRDGRPSYDGVLRPGSLVPGRFELSGKGGSDIGPFTVPLEVPADLRLRGVSAGGTLNTNGGRFIEFAWEGGDPNGVVRITGSLDGTWVCTCAQFASFGSLRFGDENPAFPILIRDRDDFRIEVSIASEGLQSVGFGAGGLTLGARAGWRYTHVIEGLRTRRTGN